MPATMVIIADRKAPGKRPAIEREAAATMRGPQRRTAHPTYRAPE